MQVKDKMLSFLRDERMSEMLRGSCYSLGAKIIITVLSVATSILGARYYGAEMVGLVAMVASILSISRMFGLMGMSTSILRLIPEYREKYSAEYAISVYRKIFLTVLCLSMIAAVILLVGADFVANTVFSSTLLAGLVPVLAIVSVFNSVREINLSFIRACKKIKELSIFDVVTKVISLLLLLGLTYFFYHRLNLVCIYLFIPVCMAIIISIYVLKVLVQPNRTGGRLGEPLPTSWALVKLSLPMLMTASLIVAIANTDIVMLGIYRATSEVGVYSIATSLALLVGFVLSSVNMISAPKFAELYYARKHDELKFVVQNTSKLMFWTALPILVVMVIAGKFLLGIYGEPFVSGYGALVILMIGQFFSATSGSVGCLLNTTGHQIAFTIIICISLVMNVLLNYLLIPQYGIDGAAIASACGMVFWNAASVLYIKNKFGFIIAYIPLIKVFSKK